MAAGCGSQPAPAPTAEPAAAAPAPVSQPVEAAAPASTAPSVTPGTADKVKALVAEAKGKTLVINVWATFCVPCVEEMPELAQFYRERDPEKVAFLSLSADPMYAIDDTVKPYVAEQKIPFPVYVLDEVDPDSLVEILGVKDSKWTGELPGTFILNPEGSLTKSWLERVHLADLKAAVSAAS